MRGDQVLELLGRIAGGTLAWILADRMGSVHNVVDNTGAVIDTIGYDGYGNVVRDTSPTTGGSYKAFGYRFDSETGWYRPDPSTGCQYVPPSGRWPSRDPIGFIPGDVNLYRYVGNAPTNQVDPLALACCDVPLQDALKEGIAIVKQTIAVMKNRRELEHKRFPRIRNALKRLELGVLEKSLRTLDAYFNINPHLVVGICSSETIEEEEGCCCEQPDSATATLRGVRVTQIKFEGVQTVKITFTPSIPHVTRAKRCRKKGDRDYRLFGDLTLDLYFP